MEYEAFAKLTRKYDYELTEDEGNLKLNFLIQ